MKKMLIAIVPLVCILVIIGILLFKAYQNGSTDLLQKQEETFAETTDLEEDEYTYDIEKLLESGKIKEAFLKVCKAESFYEESKKAQEVIETYTERISFGITMQPGACDNLFSVEETRYPASSDKMTEYDFGITLTDNKNNTSETVAIVNMKYNEEVPANEIDAKIIKSHKESLLIEVDIFMYNYSFLYKSDTNELIELKPDDCYEWYTDNKYIISQKLIPAVDDEVDLYAYNWSGELLYAKEKILATTNISDGWLYFAKMSEGEKQTDFKVYKMKLDGTEETEHYSITLPIGSYIVISSDNTISWYEYGTEKETTIDLFSLQPARYS